jgi:aminomethyltransferase
MDVTREFTFFHSPEYRRSPYFDATVRDGAVNWDLYNHMLLPMFYEQREYEEDYWQNVERAGLWDVSVERQVEITGPDAFEFTNRLVTRDLSKCAVTQCKYVILTNEGGGILNDPILLRLAENQFWLSISDNDLLFWVQGVAVNSGMKVQVREPDVAPMQIQGPRSQDVVNALFGDSILDLKYYWCREVELDGIPLVISRTGWSGEVGYELYLRDTSRGVELWDKVLEAGRRHELRPTGPNEIRRVEAGIFNWGSDMRLENNPFEITGLERLVEEQDADFIGKAALAGIRSKGVTRKLVGIEWPGPALERWVEKYWPVFHEGAEVGKVTVTYWSPRLKKQIGYAWVPTELADPGTEFEIQPTGMERITVHSASLPFWDPKKTIPKS